jgi:hypothetical protein
VGGPTIINRQWCDVEWLAIRLMFLLDYGAGWNVIAKMFRGETKKKHPAVDFIGHGPESHLPSSFTMLRTSD